MKRLAILTSGGDAPGMNAAIRAITLRALQEDIEVIGVIGGYNGLLSQEYIQLTNATVDDIIGLGGTILKSARCRQMKEEHGPLLAAKALDAMGVDALIVIGGDGSFRGCSAILKHWQGNIIGVPGTIDNDINGTDQTIGFWTAVDTAVACIDKIRDTANAFERLFIVEVMGRDCGFIAVESAVASGAEHIICKEIISNESEFLENLVQGLNSAITAHRTTSYVIVVAENSLSKTAHELSHYLEQHTNTDCKVAILGYLQRGGSPVASDRVLATKLGVAAINTVLSRKSGVMVGTEHDQISYTPFSQTSYKNTSNQALIRRLNDLNFNLS